MANYVNIEFDISSPVLEIYAPEYTTNKMVNEITITSNEALGTYQEIYSIDSVGKKTTYTFNKVSPNSFYGLIKFNDVSIGHVTLYARLKDEVDNESDLYSVVIDVRKSLSILKLKLEEKNRVINISELNQRCDVSDE